MQHRRALSAVLALALVALASGALDTRPGPAGGFDTVTVCAPIGIYVSPSTDSSYNIQIDADQVVKDQLETTVTNKVLTVGVKGGFTSSNPIKVVVNMPPTALAAIVSSSIASVQVGPGFTSSALRISQTGTGGVTVQNINVTTLTITSSGTGNIVVAGTLGATTITASGTGNVGLTGTTSTVAYTGTGVCNLFVKGTATSVITGSVSGVGSINYDGGSCNIPANFPFSSPCRQATSLTMPIVNTQWTCGLTVTGNFTSSAGQCTGQSTNFVNGVATGGSGTATSTTCNSPA